MMKMIDKETNLFYLDEMQSLYEKEISNFTIDNTEDLYDQDENTIVRKVVWNRGLKNHYVVYEMTGFIRAYSKGCPIEILVGMLNLSIDYLDKTIYFLNTNNDKETKVKINQF